MRVDSEQVKDFVRSEGADIVGIADAAHFPESFPARPPQRLMPGATAVISFGTGMLRSILEIDNMHLYTGQAKVVYHELTRIAYRTSRLLEKAGYRALAMPAEEPVEVSRETRGMVGELSMKHAAIGAGLGVMGRSRVIVTPAFGPRVNLGAVITDAPLAADAPLKEDFCTGCRVCIDACPVGALSEDMVVDTRKCVNHGAKYGLGSFIRFVNDLVTKTPEERQKALRDPFFWNLYHDVSIGTSYQCASCLRDCPVGE
ncbi:MAG: epoxyqueuosine reductase [Chloroflexi bacterium]|nr:epoxyqueuosine reductase [Chloroflexota bacterium]